MFFDFLSATFTQRIHSQRLTRKALWLRPYFKLKEAESELCVLEIYSCTISNFSVTCLCNIFYLYIRLYMYL
jgi:hypothetical protein